MTTFYINFGSAPSNKSDNKENEDQVMADEEDGYESSDP
jgi:hypothetical protein